MAFTIDPALELLHGLSKRLTAKLVGLAASNLSPGKKVRVAKSLGQVQNNLEKTASAEIGLTREGQSKTQDGVRFTLVRKDETWVIDEKACASLFPRSQYPKAWRKKRAGGNVKLEVGPYPED